MQPSWFFPKELNTCVVSEAIGSEGYILGLKLDPTVNQFDITDNEKVKFLPSDIGDKFPNLQELAVQRSALGALYKFYFKNMNNLLYLNLNENMINSIETDAFIDLIGVGCYTLLTT